MCLGYYYTFFVGIINMLEMFHGLNLSGSSTSRHGKAANPLSDLSFHLEIYQDTLEGLCHCSLHLLFCTDLEDLAHKPFHFCLQVVEVCLAASIRIPAVDEGFNEVYNLVGSSEDLGTMTSS